MSNDTNVKVENKQKRIHKLDFDRIIQEKLPYTVILNTIIDNIKDPVAFHIWTYLYSKPATWKAIKEQLKNKFGIGDSKLKSIFSYLKRANLISYTQGRNEKGKMGELVINILSGQKFNPDAPFREVKTAGLKSNPPDISSNPVQNSSPVGQFAAGRQNRTSGFGALVNKDKAVKKEKDKRERAKSALSTLSDFDEKEQTANAVKDWSNDDRNYTVDDEVDYIGNGFEQNDRNRLKNKQNLLPVMKCIGNSLLTSQSKEGRIDQKEGEKIPQMVQEAGILHDTEKKSSKKSKAIAVCSDFAFDPGLEKLAQGRGLDYQLVKQKFIAHAKSKGLPFIDPNAALEKWILSERPPIGANVVPIPKPPVPKLEKVDYVPAIKCETCNKFDCMCDRIRMRPIVDEIMKNMIPKSCLPRRLR